MNDSRNTDSFADYDGNILKRCHEFLGNVWKDIMRILWYFLDELNKRFESRLVCVLLMDDPFELLFENGC